MHLLQAFIENPVKVAVAVLLVALFGLIALFRMPMQLTPEVETPTLTISTRWPGASPQEIEREIIQEQEEELKGVEGITKMTSEAMDSSGRITLEFRIGTNMEEALLKVNSRLQQVREYPLDAYQPVISTSNSSDRPIARFMLGGRRPSDEQFDQFVQEHPHLANPIRAVRKAHNPGVLMLRLRALVEEHPEAAELLPKIDDVTKLRRFAEDVIEARFERVNGVSDAQVYGGLMDELQVIVDPQRLAARQLTIENVRAALRGQNQDTSGGDFWEGKRRYVVRTLGQFRSPEQVADQILAMREGTPVYVRDVAEVRLGYKKPDSVVRRFGASSISISVLRETGANVLEVMDGLRNAFDDMNETILKEQGLELLQTYDETDYIYAAINLVNENIVIGGLLTVAVLLLFLRSGRTTLVIGLSIPISLVGTFLMLNLMGRSLNVISLAGLSFAVGMLVDNAVVVLENIYSHYQLGKSPIKAAIDGTQEVWGAVIASTMTTLAVFLPVLFIQEEAGQLFRDIALAISSAVGLSLIVSVTVIPVLSSRLFRDKGANTTGPAKEKPWQPASGDAIAHTNGNSASRSTVTPQPHATPRKNRRRPLTWLLDKLDDLGALFVHVIVGLNAWIQKGLLRRLVIVVGMIAATFTLSYVLWPKVEYLPTGNRNLVFAMLMPPPGYNLDELLAMGETVEQELRPYWDVDPDSPEAAELDYPVIDDFFFSARGRQVFMGVRSVDPARAADMIPLVRSIGSKLPGTTAVAKQASLFERGISAGRTIEIEVTGPELEKLVHLGGQIASQVRGLMPDAQARPVPSLDLSSPELHVIPYLTRSADMGVDASDLGYTVSALIDGAYAADYYLDGEKIDLTIMGGPEYITRTQDLQALPVATPQGHLVTLGDLARVELSSGPEQINRRERQRAITIEVSPPPEIPLEVAINLINEQIVAPLRNSGELAGGYMISLSGTADKLQQTWLALRWNVLLALLITYLLMAALFESWLYPFVIIISVPLGAVGGIIGLQLLGVYLTMLGEVPQALDVLTMLGFVILIGTVVNNPILIVHQALNHMRDDGMGSIEAILESTRTRIRPIFMTTTTTVLGLAPLVFFPGAGSELYRGLGSVVLGGLIISTLFTLILVPSLFSLTMQARSAVLGLLRPRRAPALVPALAPQPVAPAPEAVKAAQLP